MRIGNAIYLDHQATTPIDSRVFDAMAPYLGDAFGNPHSAEHAIGWAAAGAVEESARKVASLVGADADEIVFTSGATEANNLALLGFCRRAAGGKRRRILCSAIEHKCVLATASALRDQLGYCLEILPVDGEGRVVVAALKEALDEDVLLVSVMAVNNEIGTIQDIENIGAVVEASGAVFHCDAAQAPTAIDLTSFGQYCHMLSLSAHKMYGPKGIGALYIRRELQDRIEPLIYGGGQQGNLRSGTVPTALCVGMAAAAEIVGQPEAIRERDAVRRLRDRLVERLKELPWATALNGAAGNERHPGNANIRFEGFSALDILNALQPRVAASTGSACASGIPEPSYVLRAIGLAEDDAGASIRFSIGRQTNAEDVDEAASLISRALARLSDSGLARTA